jgi:heme-degrading monooxygenase HmoA
MIARIWYGRTRAEDVDEYTRYMERTGVVHHRATAGNRASMVLRRLDGDEAEFIVLSLWDSLEAIRAFAGDDPEVAVYFPEDGRFLLAKEPRVRHYEVAVAEHDM